MPKTPALLVVRSTFGSQTGAFFKVEMFKKCTRLWREAHFKMKIVKAPRVWTTFGRSSVVLCGRRNGFCTIAKSEPNLRVVQQF
jgi:hypothetical protein